MHYDGTHTSEHTTAVLQDPLAEAQAAAAAAVQEREAAVRDLEQARAEHRAAPPDAEHEAMLLRVSKFLEVQKGTDLGLANDAMAQIVTEDMQLRAEDLAAQNADMTDFASMDPSKKVRKRPRFGGVCIRQSRCHQRSLICCERIFLCCWGMSRLHH